MVYFYLSCLGLLSFLKLRLTCFVKFRKFLNHYLFEYFLCCTLSFPCSWDPSGVYVTPSDVVPQVPRLWPLLPVRFLSLLAITSRAFPLSSGHYFPCVSSLFFSLDCLYSCSRTLLSVIAILVVSPSTDLSVSDTVYFSVLEFPFRSYMYNIYSSSFTASLCSFSCSQMVIILKTPVF